MVAPALPATSTDRDVEIQLLEVWRKQLLFEKKILSHFNRILSRQVSSSMRVTKTYSDSKVHGTNMGPTWVMSAPDEPHVGPRNLVIRVFTRWWYVFTDELIVGVATHGMPRGLPFHNCSVHAGGRLPWYLSQWPGIFRAVYPVHAVVVHLSKPNPVHSANRLITTTKYKGQSDLTRFETVVPTTKIPIWFPI